MNSVLNKITQFNLQTTAFGVIRSLLILPTLLLLIFNDTSIMFTYMQFSLSCENFTVPGAFCLVPNSTMHLEILRYSMIAILLLAVSGYFPRYTGILHWYICYSIQSSATTIDGGEQIATVLAFLLIPLTLLDDRKNHFKKTKNNGKRFFSQTISFLFYNLLKLQVCIIYLNAAIGRLKNEEWGDGTAIYYFFGDPIFGIPDWQHFLFSPVLESNLLIIVTWSVTLLELFLAASIFGNKDVKKLALLFGFLLHAGIMFTIGIITFSLVMMSALLFYLLPLEYDFKRVRSLSAGRNDKKVLEDAA